MSDAAQIPVFWKISENKSWIKKPLNLKSDNLKGIIHFLNVKDRTMNAYRKNTHTYTHRHTQAHTRMHTGAPPEKLDWCISFHTVMKRMTITTKKRKLNLPAIFFQTTTIISCKNIPNFLYLSLWRYAVSEILNLTCSFLKLSI